MSIVPSNLRVRAALALALLVLLAPVARANVGYLERPEVRAFIGDLSSGHGLDAAQLERILAEARHQPSVVRLIGPERTPGAAPPVRSWPRYRARFLTRQRIAAGVRYWDEHEAHLSRAEREYGVPAEVILGIIGVETAFGQNTGSFRVLDALATIAFDGPRRQAYFRDELKEFLLLANEKGLDPLAIRGSYAGAMGLPQFMPSSYRRFAVDFDGDGRIDLLDDPVDAIGSVASYLKEAGWMPGEPATVPVRLPRGRESEFVTGLARSHDVLDLRKAGIRFAATQPGGACAIVELPVPGKPSQYVAGFANFEAVTRYNRSTFYAMTVLELAEAIRSARGRHNVASARQPPTG